LQDLKNLSNETTLCNIIQKILFLRGSAVILSAFFYASSKADPWYPEVEPLKAMQLSNFYVKLPSFFAVG